MPSPLQRLAPLALAVLLSAPFGTSAQPRPPGAKDNKTGSFAKGVYLQDITNTLRMQYFRSITVSKHNPNVAYVASYEGYIFKTTDGGKTWDESRLIVERRAFFGDWGQRLYFGVHRRAGGPVVEGIGKLDLRVRYKHANRQRFSSGASGDPHSLDDPKRGKTRMIRGAIGLSPIVAGGGGRAGAAANVNFGIGLPGGAPRLQNVVRKFGKPTAGLNIKQTLYLRGYMPTEVRIIVEHPTDPKIVFACTMYGLFMTYDGGLNWVRTFQGIDWRGRRIFHAAVDPNNTKKVLLATGNGLYISEDGGQNYLKATQQGVGNGVIDWIYFNPHDSRYVFVGTDYGLLRSKDGGRNFEWIYFTTFPAARVVRYIEIDPFDKKTGYIATHDGVFTTANMLTGSLDDWKRMGGLRFTGMEMTKITADPTRRGHLWALSNMKLPKPTSAGMHDTGGHFIWESLDRGKNWRVIYAGNTWGSMQWFDIDPRDPSLLWIAWSRSLSRMRRKTGNEREPPLSAAKIKRIKGIVSAKTMPSIGDLLIAALRYNGTEYKRVLGYRWRSRIKALVPKLDLSFTYARANWPRLEFDGIYLRSIPWRFRETLRHSYREWRVMLNWDLAPLVFNLDTVLFGRIERAGADVRSEVRNTLLRFYGEYRRLTLRMLIKPPEDLRVRLFYRLRLEELESYIDFSTGGYLTRYRKGDRPSPWKTPWFERWPGTGGDLKLPKKKTPAN